MFVVFVPNPENTPAGLPKPENALPEVAGCAGAPNADVGVVDGVAPNPNDNVLEAGVVEVVVPNPVPNADVAGVAGVVEAAVPNPPPNTDTAGVAGALVAGVAGVAPKLNLLSFGNPKDDDGVVVAPSVAGFAAKLNLFPIVPFALFVFVVAGGVGHANEFDGLFSVAGVEDVGLLNGNDDTAGLASVFGKANFSFGGSVSVLGATEGAEPPKTEDPLVVAGVELPKTDAGFAEGVEVEGVGFGNAELPPPRKDPVFATEPNEFVVEPNEFTLSVVLVLPKPDDMGAEVSGLAIFAAALFWKGLAAPKGCAAPLDGVEAGVVVVAAAPVVDKGVVVGLAKLKLNFDPVLGVVVPPEAGTEALLSSAAGVAVGFTNESGCTAGVGGGPMPRPEKSVELPAFCSFLFSVAGVEAGAKENGAFVASGALLSVVLAVDAAGATEAAGLSKKCGMAGAAVV